MRPRPAITVNVQASVPAFQGGAAGGRVVQLETGQVAVLRSEPAGPGGPRTWLEPVVTPRGLTALPEPMVRVEQIRTVRTTVAPPTGSTRVPLAAGVALAVNGQRGSGPNGTRLPIEAYQGPMAQVGPRVLVQGAATPNVGLEGFFGHRRTRRPPMRAGSTRLGDGFFGSLFFGQPTPSSPAPRPPTTPPASGGVIGTPASGTNPNPPACAGGAARNSRGQCPEEVQRLCTAAGSDFEIVNGVCVAKPRTSTPTPGTTYPDYLGAQRTIEALIGSIRGCDVSADSALPADALLAPPPGTAPQNVADAYDGYKFVRYEELPTARAAARIACGLNTGTGSTGGGGTGTGTGTVTGTCPQGFAVDGNGACVPIAGAQQDPAYYGQGALQQPYLFEGGEVYGGQDPLFPPDATEKTASPAPADKVPAPKKGNAAVGIAVVGAAALGGFLLLRRKKGGRRSRSRR